jgi:hypothetical protein
MIVYGINQSNYDILSALSYVRITGNPLLLHVKARMLVHHFNITIIVRNVVSINYLRVYLGYYFAYAMAA